LFTINNITNIFYQSCGTLPYIVNLHKINILSIQFKEEWQSLNTIHPQPIWHNKYKWFCWPPIHPNNNNSKLFLNPLDFSVNEFLHNVCWNKSQQQRININVLYDSVNTNFGYKTPILYLKLVFGKLFQNWWCGVKNMVMWHLRVHNLTLTKKNCNFKIYQTINPIITPYIFSCKYLLANLWIALNMWLIKNPCKRLIFLMWNGFSRIKLYNNHVI